MEGKDHSDEISDGHKERVIGNWRKDDPYYKMAKNLTDLYSCCSVL